MRARLRSPTPPNTSFFHAAAKEVKDRLEPKKIVAKRAAKLPKDNPEGGGDSEGGDDGSDGFNDCMNRKRGRENKDRGRGDRKPRARSNSRGHGRSRSLRPPRNKSRSRSRSRSKSKSERPVRRDPSPSPSKSSSSSSSPERGRRPTPNRGRRTGNDRDRDGRPRRRRDDDSDEGGRDLQSVMIKNLAAMTASQLDKDAREEKKRSMLSKLAPEASDMFATLSARDWCDEDPKMNHFMKRLVSDKDSNKALNIMTMRTKRWSGQASDKGLLEFFATGHSAREIHDQPGGFTVFMFRPVTSAARVNKKSRQQQVKAVFGSVELDDDAVKHCSQNDFFLAKTIQDLEEQICTCVPCLKFFTERKGTATAGCEHCLELLQKDRKLFKNFFHSDPPFAAKFAHLLDKFFKNFAERLGLCHGDESPIRRARRKLKHCMTDAIDRGMSGCEESSVPNLCLPSSLRGEEREETKATAPSGGGQLEKQATRGGGGSDSGKLPAQVPGWWSTNPSPVSAWMLPKGKEHGDFFDSKDPEKQKNSQGWPKLPHHKMTDKKKNLCLKHQSKGSCNSHCFLTHVDPAKLDSDTKKAIGDRFQSICSGHKEPSSLPPRQHSAPADRSERERGDATGQHSNLRKQAKSRLRRQKARTG
jgi:hypothetical protein